MRFVIATLCLLCFSGCVAPNAVKTDLNANLDAEMGTFKSAIDTRLAAQATITSKLQADLNSQVTLTNTMKMALDNQVTLNAKLQATLDNQVQLTSTLKASFDSVVTVNTQLKASLDASNKEAADNKAQLTAMGHTITQIPIDNAQQLKTGLAGIQNSGFMAGGGVLIAVVCVVFVALLIAGLLAVLFLYYKAHSKISSLGSLISLGGGDSVDSASTRLASKVSGMSQPNRQNVLGVLSDHDPVLYNSVLSKVKLPEAANP